MRQNWLESTSASGGTGDLALISTNGFPMLSAWINSGVRQVRYSILEYNTDPSSTNASLLLAEDGYCPLDVSGPTLKRNDGTTVVFSSYNGTSLFPQMGSATAASKQVFSTASSNIRVICSAAAADNPFLAPIITTRTYGGGNTTSRGFGPLIGLALGSQFIVTNLTVGLVSYFPLVWPNFGLYSRATVEVSSVSVANPSSELHIGIYEVSKTGEPGRLLADFGNLGAITTPGVLTSAALTIPVYLSPGYYYFAIYNAGAGSLNSRLNSGQNTFVGGGPLGILGSVVNNAFTIGLSVTGQTSFTDPAPTPTTGILDNSFIPIIGLKP